MMRIDSSFATALVDQAGREIALPAEVPVGTRYRLRQDGRDCIDPHSHAITANSQWSVALNSFGDPVERMPAFEGSPVIYEIHVRDMTIHPSSESQHPGKFLGLLGKPMNYIASLGITHVQLMPVYDFATIDETGDLSFGAQYNWGYDPVTHNAVEGSYATDPHDPLVRIQELKTLIREFHARGIRVIMDVVYNHVYDAEKSLLPFRTNGEGLTNGTGCGNETASEDPRMRDYIVDSVAWWAEEFGLDGFRFDLMGVHDMETMQAVRKRLDQIDPSILIIGEAWPMGNHAPGVIPAHSDAVKHIDRIYQFDDTARDALAGSVFDIHAPGFAAGNLGYTEKIAYLLVNATDVVYAEVHDNHTLYDRLVASGVNHVEKRHRLATALVLLSPSISLLHAGQEMLRTKNGHGNSYRSSDDINAFDYERLNTYSAEPIRRILAVRSQLKGSRTAEIIAPGRIQLHIGATRVRINATEESWDDVEALSVVFR